MLALNLYLKVVPTNISYDGRLIEQCEEYNSALKNLCVVLPKENENDFIEFVLTKVENGTYVANTMKSNFVAGTQLLKRALSINSFTDEFISQFDSITDFLDSLSDTQSSTIKEDSLEFSDVVDDGAMTDAVQFSEQTTPKPEITFEDSTVSEPVKTCSVDVSNNSTKQSITQSTVELQSMYKLMQDIAISVGITNEDVLTSDEITSLYSIIDGYSPLIVKDAILTMLQNSQSESERAYVTYFTTALIETLQTLLRRVS